MRGTKGYRKVRCPHGMTGTEHEVSTNVCNTCPLIGTDGEPVFPETKDCLGIRLDQDHPRR